jgi:hypothetical protein
MWLVYDPRAELKPPKRKDTGLGFSGIGMELIWF